MRNPITSERLRAVLEQLATPFVSVLLAFAIGSLVIWAVGYDPVLAWASLLKGAFGDARRLGDTMLRSTPLIFTGLSVAYGFRAGLFNIGAEGQLFLGGLSAAWIGLLVVDLPRGVGILIMLAAGALAGAGWAFIPALLKARVGAHEVITTMMFTFIGRYFVSYLVTGPLRAEGQIPQTVKLAPGTMIPKFSETFGIDFGRAHWGFVIGIAVCVLMWWILKYTTTGYEARAVGLNQWAAETGGVSVSRTIIKSLCISGALAGLAGVIEVIGVQGRLFDQFSSGFGFTGIAVALLARNNPLGVIVAAILFGALSAGAGTMQLEADVPQKVIFIIQALVIFFVAADQIAKWVLSPLKRKGAENA